LRKNFDLKGTIQQAAMFETLNEIYKVLRGRFPSMGARRMVTTIRAEYSIKVSEYVAVTLTMPYLRLGVAERNIFIFFLVV
jgi:hypothetical protein